LFPVRWAEVSAGFWDNSCMRQLALFTVAELSAMRDRSRSRRYSPANEQFRREHARHRAWGLARRHAEKLRRAQERRDEAALEPAPSQPPAASEQAVPFADDPGPDGRDTMTDRPPVSGTDRAPASGTDPTPTDGTDRAPASGTEPAPTDGTAPAPTGGRSGGVRQRRLPRKPPRRSANSAARRSAGRRCSRPPVQPCQHSNMPETKCEDHYPNPPPKHSSHARASACPDRSGATECPSRCLKVLRGTRV
jgi:hypothetical protein